MIRICNYFILTIFFIMSPGNSAVGQRLELLDVDIEVNGKSLSYPELGNLVSPQFSSIDLNQDALMDIFVFDRAGNTVLCFINESTDTEIFYRYAPEYATYFPTTLHSWAIIRDYNGDGIGDIFCAPQVAGIPGIEVQRGSRDEQGNIKFELITFEGEDFDILLYPVNDIMANIYVAFTDIPGIEDIDGDGDLDVLTFDPGGGLINLFRNYSVEEGFGLDTFIYNQEESCWGKLREDDFTSEISLSSNPDACSSGLHQGGKLRHSGSTLTIYDPDRDGIVDVIVGDLASSSLISLRNSGDNYSGWITSLDPTFPSYDVPVEIDVFLASFLLDVNNDGKEDMIAVPNSRSGGSLDNHIWLYHDEGTDTISFSFQKSNFLINESLVVGNYSHPAFLDYDNDGDDDLLIGGNGLFINEGYFESKLFLFENVSVGDAISFRLVDGDYLGLSEIAAESGRYAPAVGDLDGDEDMDLVVGDRSGRLIYFENTAGKDMPVEFAELIYNFKGINVGQHAKPQIIDLNKDGLGDMIVGERNDNKVEGVLGGLNYFENIGEAGIPEFNSEGEAGNNTPILGTVFTRDPGFTVGASSPGFVELEEDFIAFVGSESGRLRLYRDIEDNLNGVFTLKKENMLPFNTGFNTTVATSDLNGDGFIDVAVGNGRGAILFFSTTIRYDGTTSIEEIGRNDIVSVFPNPSSGYINIESKAPIDMVEVYTISGKKILTNPGTPFTLTEKGLFIIKIYVDDKVYSKKLINF